MKKFYISDLHFGDQRVFEKCGRGYCFKDLNDYADKIVKNWNDIVMSEDEVFILGDITGGYYAPALEFIKTLNGQKYLVVGNHDLSMLAEYKKAEPFISVQDNLFIEDGDRKVHLSHYPLMDWVDCNRDGYLIYGHIHNKNLPQIKEYYRDKNAYNASCDVLGYMPKTLNEMIELKERNKHETFIN